LGSRSQEIVTRPDPRPHPRLRPGRRLSRQNRRARRRYARRQAHCLNPPAAPKSQPERDRLALLHKRRDQLVAARQQERTRPHDAPPEIAADIARHIAWLATEIVAVQPRIASLIAARRVQPRRPAAALGPRRRPPFTATALIAVARKLLLTLNVMLRDNCAFQP
jgi:transposase